MKWIKLKSTRVRISLVILVVSVITLSAIFFDNRNREDKSIFFPIFSLFATILLTDRVAAIISDVFTEEEAKNSKDAIELLPGLFAGRNDVVVFSSASEAQKYCNAVALFSIYIRNTVFRYGEYNTRDTYLTRGHYR